MNSADFKDNLNNFFKSSAFYIALGVVVLIIIALVLILVFSKKKPSKISKQDVKIDTNEWLDALGGRDNILEKRASGSRLTIVLKNPDLLNEDKLKELGVTNILKMSTKITLVFEDQAEAILSQLE